jgi:predicted regulator of Ras-like GTPase activity (Roadblock/LC7/MglB family)
VNHFPNVLLSNFNNIDSLVLTNEFGRLIGSNTGTQHHSEHLATLTAALQRYTIKSLEHCNLGHSEYTHLVIQGGHYYLIPLSQQYTLGLALNQPSDDTYQFIQQVQQLFTEYQAQPAILV